MCDSASDFSGVKVGDKLWSVQLGECEVTHAPQTDKDRIICCPMYCCHDSLCYSQDGKLMDNHPVQSLFWSRPEIIAPPKPKRKVINSVSTGGNVRGIRDIRALCDFAFKSCNGKPIYANVNVEYEVEE